VLRRFHPDIMLVIAGRGYLHDDLSNHINTLGLNDHVKLVGYLPDCDLPNLYRAADLSVVPTITLEGFGLAAVESLAAGTPVIVTPVGGLPDIMTGFRSDLIAPSSGLEDLISTIRNYIQNLGEAPTDIECRKYATENFDIEVIRERIASVYRGML
jgi:glycosyltransferase involved in cell wall biosynthesis